jgi:hypothetical protein
MACWTIRTRQQTEAERRAEVEKALEELERALMSGRVDVIIGEDGAVCFSGWIEERNDVADVCAFRTLAERGSWVLQEAVAAAEAASGLKVDPAAVSAGVHSHDGGATWSKH